MSDTDPLLGGQAGTRGTEDRLVEGPRGFADGVPPIVRAQPGGFDGDHETERVVWELAVDAARIGTFDWDLETSALRFDDRLLELFGLDRERFGGSIEAFNERVHPEDLPRVSQALEAAIETCGGYAAEYRILLPGGEVHWIAARGRALCDEDGRAVRLIGAAFDTTAEQEAEARTARVLETMPTAFFQLDTSWRFSYVNTEGERLLGKTRDELVGGVIWELFPASVGSDFETGYRRAAESGDPVSFDAWYPAPLEAWYEVRAWPNPDGLAVYFVDVTTRREVQRQNELAARRSALLAQVTAELTGTLDLEEAVGRVAPLVVPVLGDWAVVTLVAGDWEADWRRALRDVGWWHAEPALRPVVERYAGLRIEALLDVAFVPQVLRSSQPVVLPDNAAERVAAVLAPGEARDLLVGLDPSAVAIVPMRGRDRTVGLLTVFRAQDTEPFSDEDLRTLGEVAGRAGLALDNARLFAEQRDLAEGLQRSLLTAPPEPDHVEITVRYEPAAETAQVGGDWYDAFLQQDGSTVLVIGDVVGHDTAAAAAMGQVRSLLRGIAVHSGDGPATVLHGVDQVLQTLQVETTATAVVARLEATPEERERGVTQVRLSNAGHPPPMVVDADGTTHCLTHDDEADLLLGLDPGTPRSEWVVTLERGSTILLYTDGLVERRGEALDEGIARLREALTALAARDLTLDGLCDRLVRHMLPERPEDDIALVAVRLHPEDRPRPPEAGPNRLPEGVA